ncbi:hypothetical protein BC829DRAFT_419195 [Chytridium lagenaria]|nr:hypothetical protein BC829DRAFT_419195 [Chytridium lagenaria]
MALFNALQRTPSKDDIRESSDTSSSHSDEEGKGIEGDKGSVKLLSTEIYRFFNTGIQRCRTLAIRALGEHEDVIAQITDGYCYRRFHWLLAPDKLDNTKISLSERPVFFDEEPRKKQEIYLTERGESDEDLSSLSLSLSDGAHLTFNLTPPALLFNRYPFRKEMYLQNKSTSSDLQFTIQTYPAHYFSASPSHGRLLCGESIIVSVAFLPNPHMTRKNPEIQGFLRVRTCEGLPLERISLKAYNVPAIRTFPDRIKFGFCPLSETRKSVFTIQNILPIDCPIVMIIAPTLTSDAFSLSPSQVVLSPKERRTFTIKFQPNVDGDIASTLVMVAFGGEVHRIQIHGVGGQPLRIMDTKTDFGPTDIYYDKILRKVFIENNDPTQTYTIMPEYSTNEVIINSDIPMQLLPLQGKNFDMTFLSRMTGQRLEHLHLFASNTVFPPLELHAFSGPSVSIPIMEEIIFPTTQTSQPSSLHFPITNLSNAIVQCLISVPPSTWGTFRVPLTSVMVKPRKSNIAIHYLSAIAVNEVYLSRESPLDLIRRFLISPKLETTTGLMLKRQDGKMTPVVAAKSSDVFEIEPIPQICFRPQTGDDESQEVITLSNLTVIPQKYRIALSYPFYTPIETDGTLDPLTSLDIPLMINRQAFDSSYEKELKTYVALGQITVFDENQKMGMVSASIHGMVSDLVSVEIRDGTDMITFPPLRVMEKHTRRIYIHNKAPFEVVWEGRFTAKSFEGTMTQTPLDWCPFGLSSTRIGLKPFEYGMIEVGFQATSSGDEKQRGRSKRPIAPLDFRCLVGLPEVDIDVNQIHFGDVLLGDIQRREIQLTNDQTIDARVMIAVPAPFYIEETLALVPRTSTGEMDVSFQMTCGRTTKTIPVMGVAGISKLGSNLAPPMKLKGTSAYSFYDNIENFQHCIDFGLVNTLSPKTLLFKLQNLGTFEYIIKNIALGDDGHLNWKFVEEMEHPPWKTEDNEEYWDENEVDWDEADFRAKDDRINSGAGVLVVAQKDSEKVSTPARRRRLKSISYSMPAATTALHKSFPVRLPPYQVLNLNLTFSGFEKGEFKGATENQNLSFSGQKATFNPPFRFGTRSLNSASKLCTVDTLIKQQGELKFSNTATIPLNWTLKRVRTKYNPIKKFDPFPLPKNEATIPCPIETFPTSGKLFPGCTQAVDVIFSPSLPQYEVYASLVLQTEDFAETSIIVRGIGASSRLIPDVYDLDFGVLRVGTQRDFKVKLRNRGILQTRYFVECGNAQFAADPEQGLLEDNVNIKDTAAGENYNSYTRVLKATNLILLSLWIFGTALFGSPNTKPISVENKGAAEARILFTCHHPAVRLEGGNNGEVLLPANSKQDLNIIYTPQIVEYLDVKVFVRSSDSRGDYFMIQVKGSVGVPKLTLEPSSILQDLDFWHVKVFIICRHTKAFRMKNEGNILLTYRLSAEPYDPLTSNASTTLRGVEDVQFCGWSLHLGPLISNMQLNRIFRKSITVSNAGNLGVDFHIRPEGAPKDWEIEASDDKSGENWVKDLKSLGFRILNPDSHCKPYSQTNIIVEYEPVWKPRFLRLRSTSGHTRSSFPLRGFIEPYASAPLKCFSTKFESKFQMLLKVLWEREPLKINIVGSGGIGKLEINYIDEKILQ